MSFEQNEFLVADAAVVEQSQSPIAHPPIVFSSPDDYTQLDPILQKQTHADVPKTPGYDDYIRAGTEHFEAAMHNERTGKRTAAGNLYETAASKFLGALSTEPLSARGYETATTTVELPGKVGRISYAQARGYEIKDPDPLVQLQYARCLTKMLQLGVLKPYRDPVTVSMQLDRHQPPDGYFVEGRDKPVFFFHERHKNLERIAKDMFEASWKRIMEAPEPEDKVKFAAAVVVAESLQVVHDIPTAVHVLDEAAEVLDTDEHTNPKLHKFFDRPVAEMLAEARERVDEALEEITSESLALVAA